MMNTQRYLWVHVFVSLPRDRRDVHLNKRVTAVAETFSPYIEICRLYFYSDRIRA